MNKIQFLTGSVVTFFLITLPTAVSAQRDLGGMAEIDGPGGLVTEETVRNTVRSLLFRAVSFVGLIALVVIIIAGIIFVVAGSSENQREQGKKMIIFAVIGIVVIALARVFVEFFTVEIFPPNS